MVFPPYLVLLIFFLLYENFLRYRCHHSPCCLHCVPTHHTTRSFLLHVGVSLLLLRRRLRRPVCYVVLYVCTRATHVRYLRCLLFTPVHHMDDLAPTFRLWFETYSARTRDAFLYDARFTHRASLQFPIPTAGFTTAFSRRIPRYIAAALLYMCFARAYQFMPPFHAPRSAFLTPLPPRAPSAFIAYSTPPSATRR